MRKTYPSWRFHRTLPPCIVADPDADDALGDEWADTPAAFLEDAKPAQKPAAPALTRDAIAEHTVAVLVGDDPPEEDAAEEDAEEEDAPKKRHRKHRKG
jgi:hypothetical protein